MDKLSVVPIVIVAFNRPRSLERLLKSVARANYEDLRVPLIISIDKGDSNRDVLDMANAFQWEYGPKKVNYLPQNLGLRKHILQCGMLSREYGAVLILEDDLYVSPCFYQYALQALEFSRDKPYIGGISLYNHQLNVHKGIHFAPTEDGYDNWYFQFASSWGQAWTKEQFDQFLAWYEQNLELGKSDDIPDYVLSWSDRSWLKYYITYLIRNDKYFIYPRISLSTNFSDAGTHVGNDSTAYQVPLLSAPSKTYRFSTLGDSKSVYDAFFENRSVHQHLEVPEAELCVDLSGYRTHHTKRFILSPRILPYAVLRSFGQSLKPVEANIIENMAGEDIFLYDSTIKTRNLRKPDRKREIFYHIKYLSLKNAFVLFKALAIERIKYALSSH